MKSWIEMVNTQLRIFLKILFFSMSFLMKNGFVKNFNMDKEFH